MPFVRRNRFRRGVEQCELHRGHPEAGDYDIVVERLKTRRWREEARVPFNIAVADDHMPLEEVVPQ